MIHCQSDCQSVMMVGCKFRDFLIANFQGCSLFLTCPLGELPEKERPQADEMSDSESQHVLSVLELIPLKCSPKHNGKFISFIATATNPSVDEEKKVKWRP